MMKTKKKLIYVLVSCLSFQSMLCAEDKEDSIVHKGIVYAGVAAILGGFGYLLYRIFKKPKPRWNQQEVKACKPLCRDLIDEYRKITPERLTQLRDFWHSKAFNVHFKSDELVQQYTEIAYHLYKYAQEKKCDVCSLGQSFSYVILLVQFFRLLNGENPDGCMYIALSNDMNNIVRGTRNVMGYQPPDDDYLLIYYEYLKAIGFISEKERNVIICDQVESGRTIIEWDSIFKGVKRLLKPGEKLPNYTYYIHHAPLRDLPDNIPGFDFVFSLYDKPRNLKYPFELAWNSLINAKDELRLVPSYAPQDWHKVDPFIKPTKEARMLALRFLDYMVQNDLVHVLDGEKVQRSLYFHEL